MSRRHTFSNPSSEYPEHLNPFREENVTQDDGKENQVNGFRRRNSRLTASFRLNNWPMFSKKSKGSEPNNAEDGTPTKPKSGKFSTLTPRLSRHIIEALSPKKKEPPIPIPQYNTLPVKRSPAAPVNEFTLIKPNRARFAPRVLATDPVVEPEPSREPPVPEPRVSLPPVPLPRTTLSRAGSTTLDPLEQAATTTVTQAITESERIVEDEDRKYIRQGARPKKKRQAPAPPSSLAPQINQGESDASQTASATHPESASVTPDSASLTSEITSESHENASVTPPNASVRQKKATETHESASVTPDNASLTHESASVTPPCASVRQNKATIARDNSPVTPESKSVTADNASLTHASASVTPPSASVRQKKATETHKSASITRDISPVTPESGSVTSGGPSTESNPGTETEASVTPSIASKPVTLAVEEIDFTVKLYIDDDL